MKSKCEQCGSEFDKTGSRQKYCRNPCSSKTKIKKCSGCQGEYSNSTDEIFCMKCRSRIRNHGSNEPEKWNKTCQNCHSDFRSKVYNVKWCTECAYKFKLVRNRTKNRIKRNIDLSLPVKEKKKNGEGHISSRGYVYITKVGHPNSKKKGRMFEHTFAMSEYLGRPLTKNENVHHKNGIRSDNRIENLELWHRGQPPGQRVEDKIKWAKEFLEEYGFTVRPNNSE